MAECHEPEVEHTVRHDSPHGNAHAIPRISIQTRLRSIRLVPDDDRPFRRGVQPEPLWLGGKTCEGCANVINRSRLCELNPNRCGVTITYVYPITLGTYCNRCFMD